MKKIISLLLVLFIGLTLAACGGGKDKKELVKYDIITELPDEEITLNIWHSFGDEKGAMIQGYIDDFTKDYPNVKITFTGEGANYGALRDKVVNNIRTGTTPHLVFTYPDHVADYIEGEAILALDPFFNDEVVGYTQAEQDNFVDAYLEEVSQTGNYYGLPFNKSTEVLIYNKTYFEANKDKAGFEDLKIMYDKLNPTGDAEVEVVTWDMIKKASEEINTDKPQAWGFAYDSLANMFITLIRQHGGQYTNSDGEILFNNATTEAALTYYKGLHTSHLATIPKEWEEDYASTPFTDEKVYMTVGSTAGITYNVPKDKNDVILWEIGVAPIPQKDLANKQVIQQGTNISLMANTTDAQRLAGWLLMKYLASDEVTLDWAMNTGYLPVTKSALESTTYQNFLNDPEEDLKYESLAANAAYLQIDYMFYDPAFPGSSNVRINAETAMQASLFSPNKTVKQILQDAYDDLNW
jgi:multiple sugar transport system substrate-binding protein